MENNGLAHALSGCKGQRKLDWRPRQRICVGIANGLAFLHEESTLKIVHGDNKTTNLLLNEDLNSKISDFSLAKLDEEENTTSALELLELCDLLVSNLSFFHWDQLVFDLAFSN